MATVAGRNRYLVAAPNLATSSAATARGRATTMPNAEAWRSTWPAPTSRSSIRQTFSVGLAGRGARPRRALPMRKFGSTGSTRTTMELSGISLVFDHQNVRYFLLYYGIVPKHGGLRVGLLITSTCHQAGLNIHCVLILKYTMLFFILNC